MNQELAIDVWSDVACPWCYVGKRRLEGALARFGHRDAVRVTWHAFELDPTAPPEIDSAVSHVERIAKKYGMPVSKAEAATKNLVDVAKTDGIAMRFDRIKSGNTFDAHRVIHLAGEHGLQDAMKERLLLAYFTEGEAIGRSDVLVRLATEVGLDAEEVRAMLASDAMTDAVRRDERAASELGIRGVPFFVVGGRYGVSGAQPVEALLACLEKAWNDATQTTAGAEGATCGPEGCA